MNHLVLSLVGAALLIGDGIPAPQISPAQEQGIDEDEAQWPKSLEMGTNSVTIYQPQVETLKGDLLTARAAVSVTPQGSSAVSFGGVWFEARLLTDRDRRTATPVEVRVTEVRFPTAAADLASGLRQALTLEIPKWRLTLSLDHLLSALSLQNQEKASELHLKTDVPDIVYRNHPAVLVQIDGEPSWRPVAGSSLKRIANSAFFMLETPESTCLLHIPPYWWSSASPLGPWQALETAPAQSVAAWEAEPKPELPPQDPPASVPERPEVLVATRPTELLVTAGAPQYAAISGTGLLSVRNTTSDVFLEIQSQFYYVLLSGRWYRKQAGKGSWTYVAPAELPADFGRIPLGSDKQHVLACVPGTTQAREALLDAQIPQTAAVTPGEARDLSVTYDGNPDFTDIEGSPVRYAANTPYSVFLLRDRYYCCQDGVWYDSGVATGPWLVSTFVAPEIYLIPPSCPHYYCTYCHVFGVTPGAIYVGYYPGYRGCYAAGPTVVYGTGWHYPPWHGSLWYPRPVTWGVGVRYNLGTGNWRFSLGSAGPCAWMGVHAPPPGDAHAYSVGVGGWWGGVGYSHAAVDVHQNQHFAVHSDQGLSHNVYARRPERLAPIHQELPRLLPPVPVERRVPNTVYSDRQGNAYRREPEGWVQHTPQGWQKEPPKPTAREAVHEFPRMEDHHQELELHNRARDLGEERRQNFQRNNPSPPPPPPPPPARRQPPPPPPPPPPRQPQGGKK